MPTMARRHPCPDDGIWPLVRSRADAARRSGALRPVVTRMAYIRDGGIEFAVRVAGGLKDKEAAGRGDHRHVNPFSPPEPELVVAGLSPTHYCLLNKFNVIDDHLLVATHRFVDQRAPLGLADFDALAACMRGRASLGFYNAGREAGASQAHRHLQVVPLPLAPDGPGLPAESLIGHPRPGGPPERRDGLPFPHALIGTAPDAGARAVRDAYLAVLEATGLRPAAGSGWLPPYNLLVDRQWMMLVPRARDEVDGIPVNALGYAGSLLVRDEAGLARLRRAGPLNVLARAACAA